MTLYVVVHGPVFERYARQLLEDARRWFLPGEAELVVLPGRPSPDGRRPSGLFSHVSATRYNVAVEHADRLRGEWLFQIDADMRILKPVGREILADGLTVTVHPGFPAGDPDQYPYERNPASAAYVPYGSGATYHPGCFVGGERRAFFELAGEIAARVDDDLSRGEQAVWYEESHLNRYLIDRPPALVLDRRYCWWDQQWGDSSEAIIMHLDKTGEEFDQRV